MRHRFFPLLLGLALPLASARAQSACEPGTLSNAGKSVASLRRELHTIAVGEFDPKVPASVATRLAALKGSLATAADAVFACAAPDASPELLQGKLAEALHANLSDRAGSVIVTRDKKDLGAYGSDLAVQIIPVYNSPKFFEVVFRYGIECGDDNLMMVFQAGGEAGPGWHELLRWGSPGYTTIHDAFGDFVLLTPISGFPGERNWRFVVAHGQPSCSAMSAPSHFDIDVLQPAADPAHPEVVWNTQHEYRRDDVPRLATTEDTLTLELTPPTAHGKGEKVPGTPDTFSYRIDKNNAVTPNTPADTASATPTTRSPQ